jgi:hypothetical protein
MTACAPLQVWRQHWDMQLYKALEVQFRAGLETINDSLPEVRVRVVVLCARKYNTHTAPPHLTPAVYKYLAQWIVRFDRYRHVWSIGTTIAATAPGSHSSRCAAWCCIQTQIDVQLVCNSSCTLCYKPALEELRVNHISRLINGFLGLPGRMKGVSSLSEHRQGFFAPIADVDAAAVARVRGCGCCSRLL